MNYLFPSSHLSSSLIFLTSEAENLKENTFSYAGPIALGQSCFSLTSVTLLSARWTPIVLGINGSLHCDKTGTQRMLWKPYPLLAFITLWRENIVSILQTFYYIHQNSTSWQVWILYCPKKGKKDVVKERMQLKPSQEKKKTMVCLGKQISVVEFLSLINLLPDPKMRMTWSLIY